MIQDDLGIYRLQRNGTLFSFDRYDTVIDSKQLTGEEFKALSGCNMVAPGISSADHETEQCLLKRYSSTIPNSDVSVNSKRDMRVINCGIYVCFVTRNCIITQGQGCPYCVTVGGDVQLGLCLGI
jgi:hypothetical protein